MGRQMSQISKCLRPQSLTVALLAVAMAGAIALLSLGMAKPAFAAIDSVSDSLTAGAVVTQSSHATKASAFEYGTGLYLDEKGDVQTEKCWYGTREVGNTKLTRTKSYGPEFSGGWVSSGAGGGVGWAAAGGGAGYDCGAGVYITGYKGSKNAKVVVPNKIGGKPVVCIRLRGATMKSLDVSQCKSLKALSIGFQPEIGSECTIGEIKFGKNPKLAHLNFDRSTISKKLNITPSNIRVLRFWYSNPKQGFTFDTPKAVSLSFTGVSGLQMNGNKHLKELIASDCENCKLKLARMPKLVKLGVDSCALKKLDVSKNKRLKSIFARSNNFSKKTISALKKWQQAKVGRTLTL